MKKILILGAGVMQVPVIQKVSAMGFIPVVADYDSNAPGFKYSASNYVTSTLDYEGILEVAQKEQVDGILTTSDAPVRIVAKVAKVLGLNAMSEVTADICTNKLKQRVLFRESNIGCPNFEIVHSNNREIQFDTYPCIVKPIDSSASRGVSIAHSQSELKSCIDNAFVYSKSDRILVEQFVEGREYSVETFTQHGHTHMIAITEKHLLNNGYFVENTHIEPAGVSAEEANLIYIEVLKAINAVGLDNAPSHTEVKIWNGKVFIIEMACRLGGDYITSDLVPLSSGVDMLENLILAAIGQDINVTNKLQKFSAVQFVNNFNYNNCKSFIANNSNSIIRYEIEPFENKVIKNSLDRLGYIIIQRESRIEIDDTLTLLNKNE